MSEHHFWLSDTQFARLEPLLPNKPRGVPRVDDRRVISGIIHVIRNGLMWRDGRLQAAALTGWRNRVEIVVEIGRPGPHSLGPADRCAMMAPGTIHPLTMDHNRRGRNRPSARRNAMRSPARKEKCREAEGKSGA